MARPCRAQKPRTALTALTAKARGSSQGKRSKRSTAKRAGTALSAWAGVASSWRGSILSDRLARPLQSAEPVPPKRVWQLEVLWCPNQRRRGGNGWAFPPNVRKLLVDMTRGLSVVHFFGGQASFGVRLDIDPRVRPDVVGDAWLPHFRRDAFDVVILDPPYYGIDQRMQAHMLTAAAWVARKWVIWFHTQWIAGNGGCRPDRAWLVRVGDSCAVRCVQRFEVTAGKRLPSTWFTSGPAIRYNRWIGPQARLAFGPASSSEPEPRSRRSSA